ncbi:DUF4190 domain-containing protein [Blastococcus sp. CT_GayMR16]|uniref:DUF4190 domain-containing protein n=1 Tax=Blastococcus sp. CT_GayMR16 TaxID=2559607 RepID=UPI001073EB88|nr:DUF4190 domain-containing protein [Blastococcus sp. CT_GayMR16]TFV87987.1 DUF4190 domain-containing protein [Blastococcus sp. CT_GayMR16]
MTNEGGHNYGGDDPFRKADPAGSAPAGQIPAPYGGYQAPQATPYGQQFQPPPPPGYVQPYGYGYPYVPPQRTNGLAIASMVLGILWLYWIGSILALVFGYIARNQIRERGEAGGGMATAGIVLGWIGVGFLGLAIVVGIASSV